MALRYTGGSSNKTDFGTAASLNSQTAHTTMMWFYANAAGTPTRLWLEKGAYPSRNPNIIFGYNNMFLGFVVDRATTDSDASVTLTQGWYFGAFTYDETDGARIFLGTVRQDVKEAGGDYVRNVGAGASVDTSAANFLVGGSVAGSNSVDGSVAFISYYGRRMELAEIVSHQYNPRVGPGCVLFSWLGSNGAGLQRDLSGRGNHGLNTGASAVSNGPLIFPFPRPNLYKNLRLLPKIGKASQLNQAVNRSNTY